jgi:hypothetical protein
VPYPLPLDLCKIFILLLLDLDLFCKIFYLNELACKIFKVKGLFVVLGKKLAESVVQSSSGPEVQLKAKTQEVPEPLGWL